MGSRMLQYLSGGEVEDRVGGGHKTCDFDAGCGRNAETFRGGVGSSAAEARSAMEEPQWELRTRVLDTMPCFASQLDAVRQGTEGTIPPSHTVLPCQYPRHTAQHRSTATATISLLSNTTVVCVVVH